MSDRDQFAAAALAGLLAQGDDGSFSEESYARSAYRWADAMLAERDKTSAQKETGSGNVTPAPQPTLTDAEREAIDWAARMIDDLNRGDQKRAATLRGLLERLK